MSKRTKLDDFIDSGMYRSPLPANVIHALRSQPSDKEEQDRRRRMIEHGDIDPDYFNR